MFLKFAFLLFPMSISLVHVFFKAALLDVFFYRRLRWQNIVGIQIVIAYRTSLLAGDTKMFITFKFTSGLHMVFENLKGILNLRCIQGLCIISQMIGNLQFLFLSHNRRTWTNVVTLLNQLAHNSLYRTFLLNSFIYRTFLLNSVTQKLNYWLFCFLFLFIIFTACDCLRITVDFLWFNDYFVTYVFSIGPIFFWGVIHIINNYIFWHIWFS